MEEKDISEILKIFLEKIKGKRILWRLEGSANLRVQGVPVKVNDLDIATNTEGAVFFRKALKEYVVKDSYREEILSETLILQIHGFEIEVLNRNPDRKGLNMFESIREIIWKEITLPILPLADALRFYKKIERAEKVIIIEDFLKKSKLG